MIQFGTSVKFCIVADIFLCKEADKFSPELAKKCQLCKTDLGTGGQNSKGAQEGRDPTHSPAWQVRRLGRHGRIVSLQQITIKIPNPKCRLY